MWRGSTCAGACPGGGGGYVSCFPIFQLGFEHNWWVCRSVRPETEASLLIRIMDVSSQGK